MEWKNIKTCCCLKKALFLLFSVFALLFFTTLSSTSTSTSTTLSSAKSSELKFQELNIRRQLSGPGSWPPRCASKCGSCRPCRPVHVTVPPGTPVTAEYYPEAWMCKCGDRLYMP